MYENRGEVFIMVAQVLARNYYPPPPSPPPGHVARGKAVAAAAVERVLLLVVVVCGVVGPAATDGVVVVHTLVGKTMVTFQQTICEL